jgi:hypothetical protein
MYGQFLYLSFTPFCRNLNSHLISLRYVTSNLDILKSITAYRELSWSSSRCIPCRVFQSVKYVIVAYFTGLTPKYGTILTLYQSTHATDLTPKYGTLLNLHHSTHATDPTPKYGTLLSLHQSMARYWPYTKAWHSADLPPKYARYWPYTKVWHSTDLTPKHARYWPYTEVRHYTDLIPKHGTLRNLRQSMPRHSTPRTLNNVKHFCVLTVGLQNI